MGIHWKYFVLGIILGAVLLFLLIILTGLNPDRMFPMKEDSPYKQIHSSIMKEVE